MNTIKSLCKTLLASVLALGALVAPAAAISNEEAAVRNLGTTSFWVSASTDSKAMLLYYVGSATEAVVTIDHNSIDAYAPYNVADTGFGSSGSYDITAAAYDTLGELCDAIDSLSDYACVLLGAKRDDNSLLLRDQTQASGTNDLKAAGGFEVKFGTGSATASPANMENSFIIRIGATPRTGKHIVLKKCDVNVNGADNYRVFGCDMAASLQDSAAYAKSASFTPGTCNDTIKVWEEVVADDTTETYDFTAGEGEGWIFGAGKHVVVSGGNNASVQATANYVRCLFEER